MTGLDAEPPEGPREESASDEPTGISTDPGRRWAVALFGRMGEALLSSSGLEDMLNRILDLARSAGPDDLARHGEGVSSGWLSA